MAGDEGRVPVTFFVLFVNNVPFSKLHAFLRTKQKFGFEKRMAGYQSRIEKVCGRGRKKEVGKRLTSKHKKLFPIANERPPKRAMFDKVLQVNTCYWQGSV
mmetsp:Transcript_33205/g.33460  ORF Transcript_33205/g.33460 Transcript_33205/m.33460 type:complete len:101 (-) Transcript_33205:196-498(-)